MHRRARDVNRDGGGDTRTAWWGWGHAEKKIVIMGTGASQPKHGQAHLGRYRHSVFNRYPNLSLQLLQQKGKMLSSWGDWTSSSWTSWPFWTTMTITTTITTTTTTMMMMVIE